MVSGTKPAEKDMWSQLHHEASKSEPCPEAVKWFTKMEEGYTDTEESGIKKEDATMWSYTYSF